MWALALLAGYALHELLYKFLPEFKWGTQLR
jgi:hypothetical protein